MMTPFDAKWRGLVPWTEPITQPLEVPQVTRKQRECRCYACEARTVTSETLPLCDTCKAVFAVRTERRK